MKLFTTLKDIEKHNPCKNGWETLLNGLGKTKADNEPLDIMTGLKINGIKDAVWALRTIDYEDYCLFLADIAESVLHIFEAKYPEDRRPKTAIDAIRKYSEKQLSIQELRKTADAAYATADAADAAAADAAYDAAYATAADAAYATAYAADAAYATAADATAYAAADAAVYAAEKWTEIEKLFVLHFSN